MSDSHSAGGAYSTPPDFLAVLKGPASKECQTNQMPSRS